MTGSEARFLVSGGILSHSPCNFVQISDLALHFNVLCARMRGLGELELRDQAHHLVFLRLSYRMGYSR